MVGATIPPPEPRHHTNGKASSNGDHHPPAVLGHPAPGCLEAIQNILREAAKAHETYQSLMSESCQRFFESVERSVQVLSGVRPPVVAPVAPLPAIPAGVSFMEAPASFSLDHFHVHEQPALVEPARVIAPAALAPAPAPTPRPATPAASAPEADVEGAVLRVVSEKTGYPAELLNMDMDVEADLGIDSIKRVEILAALEAAMPELTGVDSSRLAGLRTLGDFRDLLRSTRTATVASPAAPAVAAPAPEAEADVEGAVLRVVSEKTGYPAELLNMDMDVEADLGIDSIKRVEILAALEAAMPELTGVDSSRLAGLRTLGDFRDLLRSTRTATVDHSPPEPVTPEEEEVVAVAPTPPSPFLRQVVRIVEAPPLGFALSGLRQASPVVILTSEERPGHVEFEVARHLATGLREQGLEVEVLPEVPATARGVIFLGGLRDIGQVEDAVAIQRQAFRAARDFAAAAEEGGVFVTVQDTGGDFGTSGCGTRAWLGGLPGLVKTAGHEWPRASLKAIDIEMAGRSPEALADALLAELLAGGPEVEVGLRADGRRVTLHCEVAPVHSVPYTGTFVRDGDVIVVSGGARGVTAAALLGLAQQYRLRLVLLGRTPLRAEPPGCAAARTEGDLVGALLQGARQAGGTITLEDARCQARQILQQREIEENLTALRRAGADVRYLSVDVRDKDALAAWLAQIRDEWGPINGLIHGAGTLADRLIRDKTEEQFDGVFSVKVAGLQSLLDATTDDPLRLICLFSSVAARVGNPGQSDYSMANEVLNKVAAAEQARRGSGCLVKAINWGAWEGGMVTPTLQERFKARGVRLLPLEEGARQLLDEIQAGSPEVEVVLGAAGDEGPLGWKPSPVSELDWKVCPGRFPFLRSHCVEGATPVLPVVVVLEWFVRAARALYPDQRVRCCRDLKVLAGVPLAEFEDGAWFRIVSRAAGPDALEVELLRGQTRHYCAVIELGARGDRQETPRWETNGKGSDWPWSVRDAYEGGRLFHGPDFQVLRSLGGLSDHGGCAELTGTADAGWGPGPWLTNPAALDGGMQLALLWALHQTSRKSLPTRLEAFVVHGEPANGPLRCDLIVRQAGRHEVVSDLLFREAGGRPAVELRGLTMTLLSSSNPKVNP
jgi:NADP-dependent 3-hydroxy acid dehydrogenase YdfG/acyl carrier protein